MAEIQNATRIRIHGDNIVECDRCLELIAEAFSAEAKLLPSDPFRPAFAIVQEGRMLFSVDLIPGHGRWDVDLQQMLRAHGAPLREATDVLIARVSADGKKELMVAALEFCSALPAGNNAWQRNGRALACAAVGIPYLYFAEVGGVELDENRSVKAPRFPNPIVPFSYLTASRTFGVACLPIYEPSPSSTAEIRASFAPSFGIEIGQRLVRAIIGGESHAQSEAELTERALLAVEILSAQRSRVDTLRGLEWKEFLNLANAQEKARWLERHNIPWVRQTSGKVKVSATFPRLTALFESASSLSVGAGAIPICLIPQVKCEQLAKKVQRLYRGALGADFVAWLASSGQPLIVVWITGFKPGGDDSRPDRGLVPLARMLFGSEARILAIVSGPGKAKMWSDFRGNRAKLANENGLWESVFNVSDAILADSATLKPSPHAILTNRKPDIRHAMVEFPAVTAPRKFTEHDVDSVLHLLFTRLAGAKVFEAMCNPPGGDWSGVVLRDFATGDEYRWTSLPRVSGKDGKRPDHMIEIAKAAGQIVLLAIESKDSATKLEERIGLRMKKYMEDLIGKPPTISKRAGGEWGLYSGVKVDLVTEIISAGAFCWCNLTNLENSLAHGQLDAAFAVEHCSGEKASLLHVITRPHARFLVPIIREASEKFGGRLEVQIY